MFRASSKSEISRSMNTVWAWLSFTLAWWTLIHDPIDLREAPSADRDHVRGERVRVEVGFDGKGDHDLARFEGGLSQFDPGLRRGRPPGLSSNSRAAASSSLSSASTMPFPIDHQPLSRRAKKGPPDGRPEDSTRRPGDRGRPADLNQPNITLAG